MPSSKYKNKKSKSDKKKPGSSYRRSGQQMSDSKINKNARKKTKFKR